MPLDDKWWDPGGPFADNSVGNITAATLRQFAQEVATQGVVGEWFRVMFELLAITPADWTGVDVTKVVWLTKTDPFDHSVNWEHVVDPNVRDTFLYLAPDGVSIQINFQPSAVVVSNATPGTTVVPVAALTLDEQVEPNELNTVQIGVPIALSADVETVNIGGWSSVIMDTTVRAVRFGLRFTPPSGGKVDDGGLNFAVDATGAGATAVTRSLAPVAT